MKVRLLIAVATLTFLIVSCSSSKMPTTPTATPAPTPAPQPKALDLAGTWSGTSVDSQGTTVVDWTVTESGNELSGTVKTNAPDPTDGSCNACHRNKSGTFTGTISGSTLTMTMKFAAGVNGDPTPICSATMTGSADSLTEGRLTGTYTGSDTCEGSFLNGKIEMARR